MHAEPRILHRRSEGGVGLAAQEYYIASRRAGERCRWLCESAAVAVRPYLLHQAGAAYGGRWLRVIVVVVVRGCREVQTGSEARQALLPLQLRLCSCHPMHLRRRVSERPGLVRVSLVQDCRLWFLRTGSWQEKA
jgi:hypothetical protein